MQISRLPSKASCPRNNVGLAKLGKGEYFGIRDNLLEVRRRKFVMHPTEVVAAQAGRWIREVDDAIKSA
jgi:hypothetical protein